RPRQVARGAGSRATERGGGFSRGVYAAARDRPSGTPECERDLSPPLSRSLRDPVDDRGGPQTFGRCDWLSGCAPHLGAEPPYSPAHSLRGAGRRHQQRRFPLDRLSKEVVLSSRKSSQPTLPEEVPALFGRSVPKGQTRISGGTGAVGHAGGLCRVVLEGPPSRMGGVRQTALRWTSTGSQVSGALYPPGGHLQQSAPVIGRWPGYLPMERLCRRWPEQGNDVGCGGINPALSCPCAALRFCPHPALRLSGQSGAQGEARAMPIAA